MLDTSRFLSDGVGKGLPFMVPFQTYSAMSEQSITVASSGASGSAPGYTGLVVDITPKTATAKKRFTGIIGLDAYVDSSYPDVISKNRLTLNGQEILIVMATYYNNDGSTPYSWTAPLTINEGDVLILNTVAGSYYYHPYRVTYTWNDNQILVNNRGSGSTQYYSYTGSITLKGSAYTYTNGVIAQRTVTFDELFTVV